MTGRELTAREQVIVHLGAGLDAAQSAAEVGTTVAEVEEVGAAFGWPRDRRRIKSAATAILHDADAGEYAGVLVRAEGQPQPAAVATEPADGGDLSDIMALLADVDRLTAPGCRATLTAPLLRAVGPDGTELVLSEAVVEVEVNLPAILAVLAGQAEPGTAVTTWVAQRLTVRGADVVRDLVPLLEELDGGVER